MTAPDISPKAEFVGGWVSTLDGRRIRITEAEATAILKQCEEADALRRAAMPDSMAALRTLHDALTRLKDEGWREGIYCPKDGSEFALIEFGSTGLFRGWYSGEWPKGYLHLNDCISRPEGTLWKPIDKLTAAEAAQLARCDEAERQMMDAQMRRFSQMDREGGA